MSAYPRTNANGETVWACCESPFGPVCAHRTQPEPVSRDTPVLTAGWNMSSYSPDPENVKVFPMTPSGHESAREYLAGEIERWIEQDADSAELHDSAHCLMDGEGGVDLPYTGELGQVHAPVLCDCACLDCEMRNGENRYAFAEATVEALRGSGADVGGWDRLPEIFVGVSIPEGNWGHTFWINHSTVGNVFGDDTSSDDYLYLVEELAG